MVSEWRIAQAGEDVPGSGDCEKQKQSAEEMELAPAAPFAGDGEIGEEGDAEDDQSEQSLGEDGQSQQGIDGIPHPAGVGTVESTDQAIE